MVKTIVDFFRNLLYGLSLFPIFKQGLENFEACVLIAEI